METLTKICRRLNLGMEVHEDGVTRVCKKDQERGVLTFRVQMPKGRRPAVVISGTDVLVLEEWCALTTVAKALLPPNGELRVC
jgi:hypothetical protein